MLRVLFWIKRRASGKSPQHEIVLKNFKHMLQRVMDTKALLIGNIKAKD
jgi:hypothetical protein